MEEHMRILVIGGTGHIGSYLVPTLVNLGWDVTVVSRQAQPRYASPKIAWPAVKWVLADRKAEQAAGTWASRMASLEADVVIDTIAYTTEETQLMINAFAGRIDHYICIGSIWAYGTPEQVPYEEHFIRRPLSPYGQQKADIESQLRKAWIRDGFPATVVHPGHISGERWLPIDPQGSRNGVEVYRRLATGQPVKILGDGSATLHHVHSQDITDLIVKAILNRSAALGECFSAVAPYAMSLKGCCRAVARLFGQEPNIEYVNDQGLIDDIGEKAASIAIDHARHSPYSSIAKGQRLLGHTPHYTTEMIYAQSITYLIESGQLVI